MAYLPEAASLSSVVRTVGELIEDLFDLPWEADVWVQRQWYDGNSEQYDYYHPILVSYEGEVTILGAVQDGETPDQYDLRAVLSD